MKAAFNFRLTSLFNKVNLFSEPSIILWAALLGVAGGLTTVAFHECVKLLQDLHSGTYGDVVQIASNWSTWEKLLIPSLGGLLGGLGLYYASKIKVDANSDYMEAVAIGNGHLSLRQGLLRIGSALSVSATGWSLGREGPIIHLASMVGSALGRANKIEGNYLRMLVACGAAAGVSAAYFAPIAGALFIAEIVLGSMASHVLAPLLISSSSAYITITILGYEPWLYQLPPIYLVGEKELLLSIVIGILSGFGAPLFLKLLSLTRDLYSKTGMALPLRMALAGFLLGCIFLIEPTAAGKGDTLIHSFMIDESWVLRSVVFILIIKLISTSVSVGSGAVGGVITPIMFIGACTAMIVTHAFALIHPSVLHFTPVFVLVGMGAFLTAGTSAPIVAIVLLMEMTNSLQIAAPLIFASVISFYISRLFTGTVMFGITTKREKQDLVSLRISQLKVRDLLSPVDTTLDPTQTLREALAIFANTGVKNLFVISQDREYLGILTNKNITQGIMSSSPLDEPIPADFIQRSFVDPLKLDMGLDEVQNSFFSYNGERLPVVDNSEKPKLVGLVYKSDLLRKLSEIKKIDERRGYKAVDIRK
ncbi:chloride channel transporter [Taylorella equigenitalis 14/56]|uniref:Chloride channel transporter n=1 Tax=Taylorella equigenitalis 14/56 TaxID=1091497 RepID=I7IIS7_9BURK|nr:chloride channel protein [Taylorella equigenitalis]CCG17722.1 chloride channel transporter [Taylorella equigenitalis 14/56]